MLITITAKRCSVNSRVSRYCGKKKLLIISHRVLYSLFMGTKYINIFPRGILFPITKQTVVLKMRRLGSIENFTNVKVRFYTNSYIILKNS